MKAGFALARNVAVLSLLGLAAVGCRSNPGDLRAGIPPKAGEVAQGKESISYTATETGRLFVYDASDDKLVGRFQVKTGQRFVVDSQAGRATLAGNEVVIKGLNGFHMYKLYFLSD